MKVHSIYTEDIGEDRRVISFSKTIFKKKPEILDYVNVFHWFDSDIIKHMNTGRLNPDVKYFSVRIKTTKGEFLQGYVREALK